MDNKKLWVIISILVILFATLSGVLLFFWFKEHPCIKEHQEYVIHQGSWIPQYNPALKMTTLQYIPKREGWETVCDIRK